jgi:orotate phosphoribosyltransferase
MNQDNRTPEQKQAGQTVARMLLEIEAINFRPQEPYMLTSGWASPVYIDCRKVISYPRVRREITRLAAQCLYRGAGYEGADAIAGGETAGIPYAAWISEEMGLPMLYVRKKPKGFGRMAQIEGDMKEGQRVVLVEDLASDGASKVTFANALRDAGATVTDAFVVFFYGVFPGTQKILNEAGLNMHYLANWWDVLDVAEHGLLYNQDDMQQVRAFLSDPVAWSQANGGKGIA